MYRVPDFSEADDRYLVLHMAPPLAKAVVTGEATKKFV
jgi:hypothetical protein